LSSTKNQLKSAQTAGQTAHDTRMKLFEQLQALRSEQRQLDAEFL